MNPITVLIVDDHEIVRQGLCVVLNLQPDIDVVAEASSGREAIQQARLHAPDVVLMDLIMPEMDGVTATRRLKSVSPHAQIIILTSFDSIVNTLVKMGFKEFVFALGLISAVRGTGPSEDPRDG